MRRFSASRQSAFPSCAHYHFPALEHADTRQYFLLIPDTLSRGAEPRGKARNGCMMISATNPRCASMYIKTMEETVDLNQGACQSLMRAAAPPYSSTDLRIWSLVLQSIQCNYNFYYVPIYRSHRKATECLYRRRKTVRNRLLRWRSL